jgi:hypothetical protein
MSPSRTERGHRVLAIAAMLAWLLGGCSDLYFDRRESIALGAGDAVAANAAEQTIDPWPASSQNNNLRFNGQRMQRAVECYRNNKVTPPVDIDPSNDTSAALVPPPPPPTCSASNGAPPTSDGNNQWNVGTIAAPAVVAAPKY